jgi:prolipoprotein diacylglyceryl transferase
MPAHLLASIPPPPVHDLTLGPLTLHLYGLLIGIAIVVAVVLAERNMPRVGRNADELLPIVAPAIVLGFVGGRLYHVASQPHRYAEHPGDIIKVWNGGLGIYGAIAAGVLTAWFVSRRRGVPIGDILDVAAPTIAIAQAIGRWGNYVNQELFGGPTTLPWGLRVDDAFRPPQYANDVTFHPTFLYESICDLAIGIGLLVLLRRWRTRPRGAIFAIYVAAYATVRFFVEGLRVDPAHAWLGLRQNQWVSAFILGAALLALVLLLRRGTRPDRAPAAPVPPAS